MFVKLFHFLHVDIREILFIGCLVEPAYPRTESESNIHVKAYVNRKKLFEIKHIILLY